jgi:hypothetical protein
MAGFIYGHGIVVTTSKIKIHPSVDLMCLQQFKHLGSLSQTDTSILPDLVPRYIEASRCLVRITVKRKGGSVHAKFDRRVATIFGTTYQRTAGSYESLSGTEDT